MDPADVYRVSVLMDDVLDALGQSHELANGRAATALA